MWHRPQLMTAVADLLFAAGAAALFVAIGLWVLRLPLFPLREVVILKAPQELTVGELERVLGSGARGNFFSVNVDQLRQGLEKLPWVRRAEVRRQWPGRLVVDIEEHRAAGRWGEGSGQLVDVYGEVFTANLRGDQDLPVLFGPLDSAPEVLRHYGELKRLLSPIERQPAQVVLSPRLAWRVTLDDGMVVELGREQQKASTRERMERFIEHYPSLLAHRSPKPVYVDMRYPNGIALRSPAGAPSTEVGVRAHRGKS